MHLLVYSLKDDIARLASTSLNDLFNQLSITDDLKRELDLPVALPPMRGWAASPDFLYLLLRHVRVAQPQTIVECGSGVSTLVLARSLQQQGRGHLYSLEHEALFAEETRRRLQEAGLADWVTVITAPLTDHSKENQQFRWYDLRELPDVPIDVLVVDGPPEKSGRAARYPVAPLLFARLSPSGVVFADDLTTSTMQQNLERWKKEFPELHAENKFVEKQCAVLRKSTA